MKKGVYMTQKEVDRANLFLEIGQKNISQSKAAKVLGLSVRHVQRLYGAYRRGGIVALASRKRGKPSNRQLPSFLKARVLELVTCEQYSGFGPTFMCEKLQQLHGINISPETTRQLMIQSGTWSAKGKKRPAIHQQRKRRARFGELLQMDGSPHAWFEDRADPCVLIVYIDDATGRTYGKFFESETTEAYMTVAAEYIKKHGRWLAAYSDKHAIFRINAPGCIKRESLTQFGRALKELEITLICANSPQAKGRVERANQTLQDRLVKELRLAGISGIEQGNQFLLTFWDEHNRRFSIPPANPDDAHRPLLPEHSLEKILCKKEYRKVSKNLEIHYKNTIYQIVLDKPFISLSRATVTVIEELSGEISIEYRGRALPFQRYYEQEFQGEIVGSKEIDRFLRKTGRKIDHKHPWRRGRSGIIENKKEAVNV
jgi:transposase